MAQTLYKGIIIAKSPPEQLSNMWLELWLLSEWKCIRVDLNNMYALLDPVDIGDFVELYDSGGPIRKLLNGPRLPKVDRLEGPRNCLRVKVNLMPLDFLLFPATAKQKNLRMAMTAELGPIPIAINNSFSLHRFYEGWATLFFSKKEQEQTIEEVYYTPWLICTERNLGESKHQNIVNALKFCLGMPKVWHHGLVVDASLRDVFFVHCAELSKLVSLRKDITGGRIEVGDWIEFIPLKVKEAEKSDDTKQIFPGDSDNMSYFDRHIACCADKIRPVFPTSISSGGKTQLCVDIEVPNHSIGNHTYGVEHLGEVHDPKRLVGFNVKGRTIAVWVQYNVNIGKKCADFIICRINGQHRSLAVPPPPPPPPPPAAVQPPPTVAVVAPPPAPCRATFLQSIDRSQQQQQQQKPPQQLMRLTHPSANTANATTVNSTNNGRGNGGQPTKVATVTDENADPNIDALRHHPQKQQSSPEGAPPPPLPSPPSAATSVPRRKPTNSIEFETVVVEAVSGRGVHSPHVFCFCSDPSQMPNNYIIRIGLNEIDKLPTLGQWVRVVMKPEKTHGNRPDYSLWEAQTMGKAKYDTDVVVEKGVHSILVRVPLRVSDKGFYSQVLGKVSDIRKRLQVPPGHERRSVSAWCQKIMPLSVCVEYHWEIALLPEPEWHEQQAFELPPESKTTFKIPFVGSRYRTQQQPATSQPLQHPSQQQQIQQPMAISKPNQQVNISQRFGARLSPALDSSGFGSSASSNSSARVERDLIDLFEEKCSIGQLRNQPSSPLPQHQFDGAMYPHTGVIASVDLKSSGYYVYSNEFDNELYLLTDELLEKGCWIKFNALGSLYRPMVGRYAKMKRSPFDVRVERNTIFMCVSAVITDDALARGVLDTSYVKNAYDKRNVLKPAHIGKELKLELLRGKADGFFWTISKIMKIGN